MLYLEDDYLTGFMAQSAKIDKIGLNHEIIQSCDLEQSIDYMNKFVIGDQCGPSDLIKIHSEKKYQ